MNPTEINIGDSEIQGKLSRYGTQRYKYCFIIDSLLISLSVVQDTNVIFLICNGLNDTRDSSYLTILKIQHLQIVLHLHLKL